MSTTEYDYRAVPVESGNAVLRRLADREPDHVYAALSGGADSVTALIFAHKSPEIDLDGVLHVETGYSRPTVTKRLDRLHAAEKIEYVHEPTALWRLVEDPREADGDAE